MLGEEDPPSFHPVDRGWAWMICLGAGVANFFVNGGIRSMGLLLVELILHYDAQPSVAAIAIGLVAAGFAIFAAFGNGLGVVLTNRLVTLTGTILVAISLIVTAFAPNIILVIIFFGFITGIGYGFMFGTSLISVGQYFVKRRSLANGLAVSGGSIGQLVLPQFLSFVLAEYGYRGALLIYAALVLHAIPAALLLRPPQFYSKGRQAAEWRRAQAEKHRAEEAKSLNFYVIRGRDSVIEAVELNLETGSIYGSTVELLKSPEAPCMDSVLLVDRGTQTPPTPKKLSVLGVCYMIITKLFDRYLLTNLVFLCLALALSLGHGGYLDVLFLLPTYCLELFGRMETGAVILSIMGIADLLGRVFGGWFSDLGLVSRPAIIGFSFTLSGLASILLPLYPSFPVMVTYTVVYGLLGGTYMALLAVIIADLFGLHRLASGMGLSTMIMGLFMIPLPTVMGLIRTSTGTTAIPVRVCGAMLVLGGILCYLIPCAKAVQEQSERKQRRKCVVRVDAAVQVKPSDLMDDQYVLSVPRPNLITQVTKF